MLITLAAFLILVPCLSKVVSYYQHKKEDKDISKVKYVRNPGEYKQAQPFSYVHNFVKIYQLTCKLFISKESTHDSSIVVIISSCNIHTVAVRCIESCLLTLFHVLLIFDCSPGRMLQKYYRNVFKITTFDLLRLNNNIIHLHKNCITFGVSFSDKGVMYLNTNFLRLNVLLLKYVHYIVIHIYN